MTFFYAALYVVTAGLCKVKKNEGIHSGFPSSFKAPKAPQKTFIIINALVEVLAIKVL
jgi:hypothetical protein